MNMNLNHLKSTGREQMSIAVTALKLILMDFVRWGMKAAVVYDYPDLIGLVNFEEVLGEDIILLKRAENPRSGLLLKYTDLFNSWLTGYLNLFGPVFNNLVLDEHTSGFANDIYLRLIYNNPQYDTSELDIDLELFSYSVMHALYCLCELVINGSVDLDAAFDPGSSYDHVMEGIWIGYLDHEDHDYSLMANLMEASVIFYEELIDFLMGLD